MSCSAELSMEKSFITSGPGFPQDNIFLFMYGNTDQGIIPVYDHP